MEKEYDLFGNEIIHDVLLRDKFIENPFSVLHAYSGNWSSRKRAWKDKGIKSEIGREDTMVSNCLDCGNKLKEMKGIKTDTSIFDPALCEVLYRWFCPEAGKILDPFAGGSVRGIVANYLGYDYTGIDIRPEQIEANNKQAADIIPNKRPTWICGDSNVVLDTIDGEYDFVFSCPPYADLEVYSDIEGDISNMPYDQFLFFYASIIKKSCAKLKSGGMACFVVGEVRDRGGTTSVSCRTRYTHSPLAE